MCGLFLRTKYITCTPDRLARCTLRHLWQPSRDYITHAHTRALKESARIVIARRCPRNPGTRVDASSCTRHCWPSAPGRTGTYGVVTCEIKHWNCFKVLYFTCNHVRKYFKIISAAKIISKWFQRLVAAHEYFPTCSMSLFSNNLRRGYAWNKTLKLFQNCIKIISFHM